MSCIDVAKVTGQHVLFLGVGTQGWALSKYQQVAQFAKDHGVDSLLLKVADGTNLWYGGINGYKQIKAVMHAEGIGCIAYTYSYGNKFSGLDGEIAILKSFLQEDGVVVADMEAEWNGQVSWASYLCSKMLGTSGTFLVSTWADPTQQNWQGVLSALNPCVDAYMPQQYNNFLASCWGQFAGAACLAPTLEMTQDVGANDPVAIARAAHDQGHTAISIWHYDTAVANPGLLDQILGAFPKTIQPQGVTVIIDLTNSTVASHFVTQDGQWHCKDTGFNIKGEILTFYQKFGGDALCGLTYLGLPLSNETIVPGKSGVVYQRYERGVLAFDPGHIIDSPPGAGRVFLLHIDSGPGQDPRIEALQTLLKSSNLGKISALGQQISDNVALIMNLSHIQ